MNKKLFSILLCTVESWTFGQSPTAPASLVVVPESGSHFHLAWEDTSLVEDGFRIERRAGGEWRTIGMLPADTNGFISTGAMPFTKYEHRVVAFNAEGEAVTEAVTSETFGLLTHRRSNIIESGSARQGEGSFIFLGEEHIELYYSDMAKVSDMAEAQISKKISKDGGLTWSDRIVVFSERGFALFLPGLLKLDGDKVLISYARRVPGEWFSKRVVRISNDAGRSWSDETIVTDGSFSYSTGSHDRIYRLSNGDILILVHSMEVEEGQPRHLVTDVYGSANNGKTWKKYTSEPLDVPLNPAEMREYGFWECTLAELSDGELVMYGRTATGWLYGTRSFDYGRTWEKPKNTGLQNPLAPPYLRKIDGKETLILLGNPIIPAVDQFFGKRYVLGSRISHDGGRTWGNFKELENHTHNWWYDYPNLLQSGDFFHVSYRAIQLTPENRGGRVHLAYTKIPVSWFLQ
jgi:hypothetical protein